MSSKCQGRGRPSKRHRREVVVLATRRLEGDLELIQQKIGAYRAELTAAIAGQWPIDTEPVPIGRAGRHLGWVEARQ